MRSSRRRIRNGRSTADPEVPDIQSAGSQGALPCVDASNLITGAWSERENGYLGADVEAHLEQVADTAADVHAPRAGEGELACGVAAVAHGQQRRRQERRLALA